MMQTPTIHDANASERWLTKSQIASHYAVSTCWVERQIRKGLPSRTIGSQRRFRLSETDAWLQV